MISRKHRWRKEDRLRKGRLAFTQLILAASQEKDRQERLGFPRDLVEVRVVDIPFGHRFVRIQEIEQIDEILVGHAG
jgi:hypothetical protein